MEFKNFKFIILVALIFLFLFSNCAGVRVYKIDKDDKKKNTAFKVYQPKPYLLVEYNSGKDTKMKTSFVYLPDLANPIYLKQRNGFGSSSLEFSIANGQLTSFGSTTDSKVPETISAIGSLSGLAGLLGGGDDGDLESADASDIEKIDEILEIILVDIKKFQPITNLNFSKIQKENFEKITDILEKSKKITEPSTTNRIEELKRYFDDFIWSSSQILFIEPTESLEKLFNNSFIEYKNKVELAKTFLEKKDDKKESKEEKSTFKLYEITNNKNGMIFLNEVELKGK